MQLSGWFPFRMPATDGPPVFSLCLALWSVFVVFMTTCISFIIYKNNLVTHGSFSVATAIYLYSVLTVLAGVTLSKVIMTMQSSKLAALLHHLSTLKHAASATPAMPHWLCRSNTIAVVISLIIASFVLALTDSQFMNMSSLCLVLIFLPTSFIGSVGFLLPTELPATVFGFLAFHLLAATQAAVAKVTFLLNTDGCFKNEDSVRAAKEVLRELQDVIRQVMWVGARARLFAVQLIVLKRSAYSCPGKVVISCIFFSSSG